MPREGIETRFSYKGFGFNFEVGDWVMPFVKTEEEAREQFKRMFDSYGDEIVSMVNGEVVVNWEQYFTQARKWRGEDVLDVYVRILLALGIISFQLNSNWIVIHNGTVVTPSIDRFSKQYFTRKIDAIEYVKASRVSGGSLMIFRTDEIIFKEELERA